MLVVSNSNGSATGTGSVNVQAGALGGKGIMSGAVTIGTGSGNGAHCLPRQLGPMCRPRSQSEARSLSMLMRSTIVPSGQNGTWPRTDEVFANGITINSGAMIALRGQTQGRLTTGLNSDSDR